MDLTQFIYIFVVILFFAKVLGAFSQYLGQPAVLGELLAGVVIGPYVLNLLPGNDIFEHNSMFYLLAEIGLLLLLFEIGLETSLKDLIKVGKRSFMIGVSGVIFPFVITYAFCFMIGKTSMEIVLVAAALTATSIGITSKVFSDLGFLSSNEAKIVIGAAIIDDILALSILSVISAVATTDQKISLMFIFTTIAVSLLFLVLAVVIGQLSVKHLIFILEKMKIRGIVATGAIAFAFVLSFAAIKSGSSIVIGAFAAGVLLAETKQKAIMEEGLKPLVDIFTPIFFVYVGFAFNITVFNIFNPANLTIIMWIAGLFAIAVVSKYISGFVIKAEPGIDRNIIGVSMVPRGEVGLIFASMGLSAGILRENTYTIIVAAVILSTIVVPPMLKYLIARKNRLAKELLE